MRTASPWWASLVYALGLVLLFTGERAFSDHSTVHLLASGLGTVLVVGVTAARVWTMLSSRGARRKVELILLLCHLVAGLALVLYALTTKTGMGWLGWSDLTVKSAQKTQTILLVLWLILIGLALIPLFMIEVSLGAARRSWFDLGARKAQAVEDEGVELVRVKQIALSGVTIALAGALMVVTYDVSTDHNWRRDVSYFKTSAPGTSTINIVKNYSKPIRVLLFFPEVNEVKDQLKDYFDTLGAATGGKITVEVHDRETEPKLAAHYHIQKDGTVLLTTATPDEDKVEKSDKPPKAETFDEETDMQKARLGKTSKLRTLDREVNKALLKLMREKLKVYLTVGHGEMNDPESANASVRGTLPLRGVSLLKLVLGMDNYEVRDLGSFQLASGVPDDAAVVMVLAPSQPLDPEEYDALDKYVGKGGHLLIALDPLGTSDLGPLAGRLGVQMKKGILADDKYYLDRHHGAAGHQIALTTQFSAHAATTSLSRAAANVALPLITSGALEDHDFTAGGGEQPKRTYIIHSMPNSWLDLDGDFELGDSEKRDRYNVAAAIEGPKVTGDDGKEKDGWKALVFADADLFADYPPPQLGSAQGITSGPLIEDATKWLAGESMLAGEVVSEDDVAIQHTRSQDQIWFYLTVLGAPMVVLAAGLVLTLGRGRRRIAPAKNEVAS